MAKAFATVIDSSERSRRFRILAALGSALVVAAIAIAVVNLQGGNASVSPASASSTASPTEVPTTLSVPANPRTTDPSFFPPANGPGQPAITQAQAASSAQGQAVSAAGAQLTSEQQAALPTYSRLMSYADAVTLVGDGADPRIDPSRQVWVVTVLGHHPVDTMTSTSNPTTDKYTIVTDATTGVMILGAYGVASLTSATGGSSAGCATASATLLTPMRITPMRSASYRPEVARCPMS